MPLIPAVCGCGQLTALKLVTGKRTALIARVLKKLIKLINVAATPENLRGRLELSDKLILSGSQFPETENCSETTDCKLFGIVYRIIAIDSLQSLPI